MVPIPNVSGDNNVVKRLLVVEDDCDIVGLIRHALRSDGCQNIEVVGSGQAVLESIGNDPPDAIIRDLNLPDVNGFEVGRIVRSKARGGEIPIIVVTACQSEADRVLALDLGADDYVTKPFSLIELVARVRADGEVRSPGVYRGKHLNADFAVIAISVDGQPIRLTRREFGLLHYLVPNRNRVLTRWQLIHRVWRGVDEIDARTVTVHVGRLRAKLGKAGEQIDILFGVGYRFVEGQS